MDIRLTQNVLQVAIATQMCEAIKGISISKGLFLLSFRLFVRSFSKYFRTLRMRFSVWLSQFRMVCCFIICSSFSFVFSVNVLTIALAVFKVCTLFFCHNENGFGHSLGNELHELLILAPHIKFLSIQQKEMRLWHYHNTKPWQSLKTEAHFWWDWHKILFS